VPRRARRALPVRDGIDARRGGPAVRYDAHKSILGSSVAWEALRGFYAIGGTRIKMLDVALALGLAGGIAVPALHFAVRRLCRRPPKDRSPQ